MIEVDAQVIGIVDGSRYQVRPQRKNACGGCSSQSGCASGAFIKIFPIPDRPLIIDSDTRLTVGQRILIGLDERIIQRFALVTYLLPLLGLLFGSMLGNYLALQLGFSGDEMPAILSGLMGIGVGFYAAKIIIDRLMREETSKIKLLSVNPSRISIESLHI